MKGTEKRGISAAQSNALLVVFSLGITGILTILPSYSNIFPTERRVVVMKNFFDMQQLPLGFDLLMLMTCAFIACNFTIPVVAWSQLGGDGIAFCLRAVVLFVEAIGFICYSILLQPLTLNFRISIGGDHISGFWLLWLYSICTILIWGTLLLIVLIVKRNLPRYFGRFSQP